MTEIADRQGQKSDAVELLRRTSVEVAPSSYFLIGMRHEDWTRLLENPELSPRASAPFMLLRDQFEVTLMLTIRIGTRCDTRQRRAHRGGFRLRH